MTFLRLQRCSVAAPVLSMNAHSERQPRCRSKFFYRPFRESTLLLVVVALFGIRSHVSYLWNNSKLFKSGGVGSANLAAPLGLSFPHEGFVDGYARAVTKRATRIIVCKHLKVCDGQLREDSIAARSQPISRHIGRACSRTIWSPIVLMLR